MYFNTVEGVVLYEENPDWIVSYQGKQTASDNSGYGDVIQVTLYNTENSFFAFTVPLADYEAKGIAACIEEAIAEKEESFAQWEEEGYIVDRSDYIYNSTAAFILETGDEGEYVGIAAGVDENFKATGLYAVSAPFTPEPVIPRGSNTLSCTFSSQLLPVTFSMILAAMMNVMLLYLKSPLKL